MPRSSSCARLVINEQYSRIPVYEKNIDQVIGFVHVRDMFELEGEERESGGCANWCAPIMFVPETKPVNDLMREMQQENTHMVIVVDEYGNTAGLATMEDLLEVIIGEIRDEHEPESDVTEDGHGGYIVSGSFDVDRVADLFAGFHPEEDIESTTVGGLVSEWLGRVPRPANPWSATACASTCWPATSCAWSRCGSANPRRWRSERRRRSERNWRGERGLQIGIRLADRAAERGQIHAAECAGGAQAGHRGGQAADHANLRPGRADAARGADRLPRHAGHPQGRFAVQQAPDGHGARGSRGARPAAATWPTRRARFGEDRTAAPSTWFKRPGRRWCWC